MTEGCPTKNSSVGIDRSNLKKLGPETERLIWLWFQRARDELNEDPFGSFIYGWIAINGWAACCTRKDKDPVLVDAMASDDSLTEAFEVVKRDSAALGNRDWVREFYGYWPIERAADLRSRPKTVRREPSCYERHAREGDRCPLDWPHTLTAIYRVRNNLFHGEKSVHMARDTEIVTAAAHTLVPLLERALASD